MCHFDNKLRKMKTTTINGDYEINVYMEHLPRSHLGPINPGLHA